MRVNLKPLITKHDAYSAMHIVGTIGLAIIGLSFSSWLSALSCTTGDVVKTCSFSEHAGQLATRLDAPLVYLLLTIVLFGYGTYKVVGRGQEIFTLTSERDLANSELERERQNFRNEEVAHAETKFSFINNLRGYIDTVFSSSSHGFNENSRLTVYRLNSENDQELKRIHRYCQQKKYADSGRLYIPCNEGVVGLAWSGVGREYFSCEFPANHRDNTRALKTYLNGSTCNIVDVNLTMPTKSLYARRIPHPHASTQYIGILVIESTDENNIDADAIDAIIDGRTAEIARAILSLGHLDGTLNPDYEVEK